MKKLIFVSVIGLIAFNTSAQKSAAVGKKVQLTTDMKTTIVTNAMGNDFEIKSDATIVNEVEIKAIEGKKLTANVNMKLVKGKSVTPMGEQAFSSDDATTVNNPALADAFKDLNKPKDVTIEIGKPTLSSDVTGAQSGEDIAAYLISPFDNNAKEGAVITDSASNAEGTKSVNVYTVTKITKEEITVTVASNSVITGTKQQMGMEIKINMQASATATRIYDAVNGLLKSETKTFSASGNNETQGMTMPVNVKGTSTIAVK